MGRLSDYFPDHHPAMMEFDGATSFYFKSYTSSGNKVATVVRFKVASFTGGGASYVVRILGPGQDRAVVLFFSSDHADSDRANRVLVRTRNSDVTIICDLYSPIGFLDDKVHTLFYSFDGDAGTALFYIDGNDADDTGNADRIAPTTGTLDSGASSSIFIGAANSTPTNVLDGDAGFVGHREAYLTNPLDFMDAKGNPKALDESGWTEWGAQPLFWNEHGEMDNNLGSAGNMTVNGTIILGKGGN